MSNVLYLNWLRLFFELKNTIMTAKFALKLFLYNVFWRKVVVKNEYKHFELS